MSQPETSGTQSRLYHLGNLELRTEEEVRVAAFLLALGVRFDYRPEEWRLRPGRGASFTFTPPFFVHMCPEAGYEPEWGYWVIPADCVSGPSGLSSGDLACLATVSNHHTVVLTSLDAEYPDNLDQSKALRGSTFSRNTGKPAESFPLHWLVVASGCCVPSLVGGRGGLNYSDSSMRRIFNASRALADCVLGVDR